jgi:nucleotide-binding universal stress UspA family protein
MKPSSRDPKGLAVVALAFDDRKEALIQTAISLAHRFDVSLKLVHVVEPPMYDTMAVEAPTVISIPAAVLEDVARQIKDRKMEMNALVERIKKNHIDVSGEVLEGDAIRTIIGSAVNARANMILTACHPESNRFLPQGLSTALSLMHEAPLPVLVMGASPLNFEQEGLRIMIADDLQASTREAVRKSYELASLAPKSHIRHVHIHGDFRETLKETWRDLREKVPGLKELTVTPDSIWREEYEARLLALRRQSMPFRLQAEKAKVLIEPDIRTGSVRTELHNVTAEFDPHLCVFGRHRLLRTRPFLIGRVPLHIMIEERRCVLLVPPREDLYAALPFPAAAE